jgi:D-serine deaminase-like pyridoxal phosphate-dependent protein
VHLGVRRSPLRAPAEVVALARRIAGSKHVRFRGLLAYEAQIAGLPDAVEGQPLRSAALRGMKGGSRRDVRAARAAIASALREAGLAPALFNGGGTGSIASSPAEDALTEVTAGSGFLASHLFDHLDGLPLRPAIFFALQAVRRPAPDMVTCHGGGLIASGAPAADRLPKPAWPAGLELLPLEGAGEVQTPLRGARVELGAPVFFRPAKAGEPAERFDTLLLVRGDKVVGRALTYRGMGKCFG